MPPVTRRRAILPGSSGSNASSSSGGNRSRRGRPSSRGGSSNRRSGNDDHGGGGGNGGSRAGHNAPPPLLKLADHFNMLTTVLLQRIAPSDLSDTLVTKHAAMLKRTCLEQLQTEYKSLLAFYENPTSVIPLCLTKSPCQMLFYLFCQETRVLKDDLLPRLTEELKSFLEQDLGFKNVRISVCTGMLVVDIPLEKYCLRGATPSGRPHLDMESLSKLIEM